MALMCRLRWCKEQMNYLQSVNRMPKSARFAVLADVWTRRSLLATTVDERTTDAVLCCVPSLL